MSVSVFDGILSSMKTFNFVLILAGNLIILCQILFCYLLITVEKEVILLSVWINQYSLLNIIMQYTGYHRNSFSVGVSYAAV